MDNHDESRDDKSTRRQDYEQKKENREKHTYTFWESIEHANFKIARMPKNMPGRNRKIRQMVKKLRERFPHMKILLENDSISVGDKELTSTSLEDWTSDPFGVIEKLKQTITGKLGEMFLNHLEDIALKVVMIRDCKSMAGVAAVLIDYAKQRLGNGTSLFLQLRDYIKEVLTSATFMESHSKPFEATEQIPTASIGEGADATIEALRQTRETWDLFTNAPVWKHMKTIVSILLALGLNDGENYTVSVKGIKAFEIAASSTLDTAFDLFDAVIRGGTYFLQHFLLCMQVGNFSPFLYDNTKLYDFEARYQKALSWSAHIGSQTFRQAGINIKEFDVLLNQLLKESEEMLKFLNGYARTAMERRRATLLAWHHAMANARLKSGFKEAPIVIGIDGLSGLGKSSIMQIFIQEICAAFGIDGSFEAQATIQSNSKFWDAVTGRTEVLILDDLCSTKLEFQMDPDSGKLILIANNVPAYAPKAAVDEKGSVPVDVRLVLVSSNVMEKLGLHSNNPYSILRRIDFCVSPTVRPQYQRRVGLVRYPELCAERVAHEHPALDEMGKVIYDEFGVPMVEENFLPDLWEFDIKKAISSVDKNTLVQTGRYETIEGCEKLNIFDTVKYLVEQTRIHYSNQAQLVERQRKMVTAFKPRCPHGCGFSDLLCSKSPCQGREDALANPEPEPDELSEISSDYSLSTTESQKVFETDDEEPVELESHSLLSTVAGAALTVASQSDAPKSRTQRFLEWTGFVEEAKPRSLLELTKSVMFGTPTVVSGMDTASEMYSSALGDCRSMLRAYKREHNHFFRWTSWVPAPWLDSEMVKALLLHRHSRRIQRHTRIARSLVISAFAYQSMRDRKVSLYSSVGTLGICWMLKRTFVKSLEVKLIDHAKDGSGAMPEIIKAWRDDVKTEYVKRAAVLLAGVGILATAATMISHGQSTSHSLLQPETQEEYDRRTDGKYQYVETKYEKMIRPVGEKAANSTVEQLENRMLGNQWCCRWSEDGKGESFSCLQLCSTILAAPAHPFRRMTKGILRCSKASGDKGELVRIVNVDTLNLVFVKGCDVAFIYTANLTDAKDLADFLPKEPVKGTILFKTIPSRILRLVRDEVVPGKEIVFTRISESVVATCGGINASRAGKIQGYTYPLKNTSEAGQCGGVLITDVKTAPSIYGIHIAGNGLVGGAVPLTRSVYDDVVEIFEKKFLRPVLMSHSAPFPPERYGQPCFTDAPVAKSSPLNFLPLSTNIERVSGCQKAGQFRYAIVKTLISPAVEAEFGIKDVYTVPKTRPSWYPWAYDIERRMAQPSGFHPEELELASRDWYYGMAKVLLKQKDVIDLNITPLSRDEMLNGRKRARFINPLVMSTSIGYPLTGAKSKFNPDDPERGLDPMFWDEYDKSVELWKAGSRNNSVFKAFIKAEPVKRLKADGSVNDKTRMVCGSDIVLSLAIRKYFLPIINWMCMNPIISECCVGVNCVGPEWNELMDHIISASDEDEYLAGDYSKFDMSMNGDEIACVTSVFIKLAQISGGYSEEDIKIMEAIACEVYWPLLAHNGDCLRLGGFNSSGNNMTSGINSGVAVTRLRVCFNRIRKKKMLPFMPFRNAVRATSLGDDHFSKNEKGHDYFNTMSVRDELNSVGISYTMADKDAPFVKFTTLMGSGFLKRTSVFEPELKMWMGALDEESIVKSLLVTDSSVDPREHAEVVIDGAMREYFYHGRDVYEERRKKFSRIQDAHGIKSRSCDLSYDLRLRLWCDRYGVDPPRPGVELVIMDGFEV